jgi:NAD(P)-dependent dehydrogenase (short-subunit alcohol dehydrogenase family)
VATAVETVGKLDVLVNNAGIRSGRIGPSEATADHMQTVYETNVFGPVRILHAFIPLLEQSAAPVIVTVSSGVGSLSLAADPTGPWRAARYPVYASSKAALNMLTIRYAAAFPRIRINSVDPGFTATGPFHSRKKAQRMADEQHARGARGAGRLARAGPDETQRERACLRRVPAEPHRLETLHRLFGQGTVAPHKTERA